MRKYFQISAVTLAFFVLVFVKNFLSTENNLVSGNASLNPNQGLLPQNPTNNTVSASNVAPLAATPPPGSANTTQRGIYKDGTYTGSVEDAYYGNMQVAAVISGGRLTDIQFLQYPSDNRTSLRINSQALPILKSEAIAVQSANIDMISGASASSPAFQSSLANALKAAK